MKPTVRIALLAAALLAAGAAQADCRPLLDALNRMAQQSRFAAYDVDSPEQPLNREPDVVIVGTVSYVRSDGEWERVEIGELGGHWAQLRKELAAGELNCSTAGTGRHRGSPVTQLTVKRAKAKDPSRIFIDRRSGLPVYEGTADGSGLAVVYGDAVKEPKVKR